MPPEKIAVAWSSGKDSAMTLYRLRRNPAYEVTVLFTTVTGTYDRVSMHGVRRELLLRQAEAAGLPLIICEIPPECPNTVYEARMREGCERLKAAGAASIAFGDLFLEDVRDYRIRNLQGTGLKPVFPVWQEPTPQFARELIGAGIRTTVVCVDTQQLPASFAGRDFDHQFLSDLPPEADPCGERGEFHTFVWDGPFFSRPVRFTRGETVTRENRFCFCDLMAA
ncbi:MAG: adenine nucleotide alpha hydrolase [Deltaproteobacteria bacterium]|nr:adenine nucleotide alpha hydrolase [Deltaproteobacteria bacterium]